MQEIWKQYPLNPNYFVSNLGNVKNKKGHLMKFKKDSKGYLFISASLQGKKTTTLIHRMVKITFDFVEDYKNLTVDHLNGRKEDNRLENLEWCYNSENVARMFKNRSTIKQEINRLIFKYGYEKTLKKLQQIS